MKEINSLWENALSATDNGDYDTAITLYKEILNLSQDNIEVQHHATTNMLDCLLYSKQYSQADKILNDEIKKDPSNPDWYYLQGCSYTYQDEINKAISSLKNAIALKGEHTKALGQLGWVVGHNIDPHEGIKYLKKSLQIEPDNPNALRDLCMLYAKINDFKTAMLCIDEALERNPDDEFTLGVKENLEKFRVMFDDQ